MLNPEKSALYLLHESILITLIHKKMSSACLAIVRKHDFAPGAASWNLLSHFEHTVVADAWR